MLAKLLIANRGEVAIRVAQAAAELGIATVAIYADDDAHSLHVRRAGAAVALGAAGVPAYLDGARILEIARDTGCDAVHPGYGFLSENAGFARACGTAGVRFVGPRPEVPQYVGKYTEAQRRVLSLKPGITDLATLEFREEEALLSSSPDPERLYIDYCMRRKIELNLAYAAQGSLWKDTKIILWTLIPRSAMKDRLKILS
jgi:pyruvate carboxylase